LTMLFKKTREIAEKIDNFLDVIQKASIDFKKGWICFLNGEIKECKLFTESVDSLEEKADALRREIENNIYSETLIPQSRGDVLAILENSDNVLNLLSRITIHLLIEMPEINKKYKKNFIELVDAVSDAVDAMVMAVRSYFKDIATIRDYINKVKIFEKDTDRIGEELERAVFKEKIELARKIQIKYFVEKLEQIADLAEDVTDRLTIYSIKRETW